MRHLHLSGKDNMLPSRDEAWRLLSALENCKVRFFRNNGHTILLVGEEFIIVFSEIVLKPVAIFLLLKRTEDDFSQQKKKRLLTNK